MIVYNSLSFKLAKDDTTQTAIIRFTATDGEQIAMMMSGEGLEQLARTILTVLENNPEMRDWKSAQQQ